MQMAVGETVGELREAVGRIGQGVTEFEVPCPGCRDEELQRDASAQHNEIDVSVTDRAASARAIGGRTIYDVPNLSASILRARHPYPVCTRLDTKNVKACCREGEARL